MKLLSIAVPAYNSEAYLETCLQSLLGVGGDAVEILIVDDGSKDATAAMADRYAGEHPGRVIAIHQENGGHGEAVNAGLRHASGLYFKVVDSDDWLDPEAFARVFELLQSFAADPEPVDLLITNFVYEKVGVRQLKFHQLEIVTAISSILLVRSGTPAHRAQRDRLWELIEDFDPALHLRLRKRFLGRLTRERWGRWVAVTLYGVAQRLFSFN